MDRNELQNQAEYYRNLYNMGQCDRELAKEKIEPYLEFVNNKMKEIGKKYNRKVKYVSFSSYVR